MEEKSVVLRESEIHQKIDRIAFQIYETTFEENIVYVGGISGNGFLLAERLVSRLNEISEQSIRLFQLTIDKDQPLKSQVKLSIADEDLSEATVILVDDVINSGRTMSYAVRKILEYEINVLKIATLVNRTHRRFPVHADFVGMDIASTLKDHIRVELDEKPMAFLE